MKTNEYNIFIDGSNMHLILNLYNGAIDEIDIDLKTLLTRPTLHSHVNLDADINNYLIERGYVYEVLPSTNNAPNKTLIHTDMRSEYTIIHCFRKSQQKNIAYGNLFLIQDDWFCYDKLIFCFDVDSIEDLFLCEDKINHCMYKGISVEVNIRVRHTQIDKLLGIFQKIMIKGWVFLNTFSVNILPDRYNGCPLGRVFSYDKAFLRNFLEFTDTYNYLQYFSLLKLNGANVIWNYMWNRNINPHLSFCDYYTRCEDIVRDEWYCCKNCALLPKDSKPVDHQSIIAEAQNNAQMVFNHYKEELI